MSVSAITRQTVTLTSAFGVAYAGLATVGYTIYNGDGTTFRSRTTTGVAEAPSGTGNYRVRLANTVFVAAFDGYVVWDTGGTGPVYSEAENIFINAPTTIRAES